MDAYTVRTTDFAADGLLDVIYDDFTHTEGDPHTTGVHPLTAAPLDVNR